MTPASRAAQLRQIKAAARALFDGDEAAERDCYAAITGLRYCRAMSAAQLRQVGDYLARATGHKPDRPIAFRPSSSADLASRLDALAAAPPPGTWRINPLRTERLFRAQTGLDPCPFAHLGSDQQAALYRAALTIWRRAGAEIPPAARPPRRRSRRSGDGADAPAPIESEHAAPAHRAGAQTPA